MTCYIALVVLLVVVLLPLLLLLLYTVWCYQQCLSHCGVGWHTHHIFLQRWNLRLPTFPTIQLILCIALLTSLAITLNELFRALASVIHPLKKVKK